MHAICAPPPPPHTHLSRGAPAASFPGNMLLAPFLTMQVSWVDADLSLAPFPRHGCVLSAGMPVCACTRTPHRFTAPSCRHPQPLLLLTHACRLQSSTESSSNGFGFRLPATMPSLTTLNVDTGALVWGWKSYVHTRSGAAVHIVHGQCDTCSGYAGHAQHMHVLSSRRSDRASLRRTQPASLARRIRIPCMPARPHRRRCARSAPGRRHPTGSQRFGNRCEHGIRRTG